MSADVWVWVGLLWTERVRMALREYGDRITDVSIFGWSVGADGSLSPTFDPALLDEYRQKWPHIRWWGCFRNMDDPNDGPFAIFEALRDSSTARAHLADEVETKMLGAHPWLHGVDIDMELGGDERSADSEAIFQAVADRAHQLGRQSSAALPGLTIDGSVGSENWVRYKELGQILDHVSIMTYDFAWNGSAPGPISPAFWLEDVYDWAASQIAPSKLSMGLPLYGRFWQIYDYPASLGDAYRGASGTYYAIWQYFTGSRAWSDSGSHHKIGWITYRDATSRGLWGFLDCYDWKQPSDWASATGVNTGAFNEREYAVRYGLPAGSPQWTLADNTAGDALITYELVPEPVTASDGSTVSPKVGYTLTAEMLQREPVAATIIDDYASNQQQLTTVYAQASGSWEHEAVTDTYRQYRGSGELVFDHDFGAQALYVQARFQFAEAGRFGVTARGITADVSDAGHLRIRQGATVLAETYVPSRKVGAAAGRGRAVLALRVREGTARAYFSLAEASMPLQLKVDVAPPGGLAGFTSSGEVWIDHTYLGDGWWYQPREAVQVAAGGQTAVLGRKPRTGVTWDTENRFRPDTDVDEHETRTAGISPDWTYEHWKDAPFANGQADTLDVVPVDHDLWLGRIMLVDRDGSSVVYFSDPVTINHWRSRAVHDWGLAGIALWSLGQEDMRMWETFEGGMLPQSTKRLDE